MNTQNLIPVVLALQFAAFGWRVNREITVGEEGRRTWLPVADIINIASLLAVVVFCIIIPLGGRGSEKTINIVLAGSCALIALHPLNMAAHYRLFSKEGRGKYDSLGKNYPYITDQEVATLFITAIILTVILIFIA